VHDLFPDRTAMAQAADLVKRENPALVKEQWADAVSDITNHPERHAPELVAGLKGVLGGEAWQKKLMLVGFEGGVDPERILPAVLLFNIPAGLRGLLLIVLLAAAMSTFNATINMTTGYVTRDIYQKYLHRAASTRELIYVSWATVLGLTAVSFVFAYSVKSINDIWDWIIMGLGGGLMVPLLLRLLWWRFNGGGFALGTFTGLTAAILQRALYPGMDPRLQFLFLGCVGLAASIIGTYLTPPEDVKAVGRFYRITRPFGVWGPFRRALPPAERAAMELEHRRDILCVPFALLWQVNMFLMPMQAVIGAWSGFAVSFVLFCVGLTGMYFLWFRHLPKENYFESGEEAGVKLGHETREETA